MGGAYAYSVYVCMCVYEQERQLRYEDIKRDLESFFLVDGNASFWDFEAILWVGDRYS